MRFRRTLSSLLLAGSFPVFAAQDLYVYPAQGQTSEEKEVDERDCRSWAIEEVGIDPLETPEAPEEPEVVRGRVLGGAAVGGAIGAIAGDSDDAAKGAAIGGALGLMRQSSRNREAQQRYQQEVAAAQQKEQQQRENYRRAYAACLEARGYTVK